MGKVKDLWKGIFNYSLEITPVYAHAYSKKQAKVCMLAQLARLHGVGISAVWGKFPDGAANYEIRLETEWQEMEE